MKNRPLMYCINYLEAYDIDCYMQGDAVLVHHGDLELMLSQEEVNYRAERWLESELAGVREGIRANRAKEK